ncbi:MAG: hypothetical protein Q4E98_04985 [Acidaminococcaceae bacterium]|jgi:hypothetical protein|uniref:hypothetical protein n=1 Tax=uncultured Phascolarctobacterium sp. TaxID=512296 RepID=UPI0025FCBDB1|nr:hypothetical protein [uncultured Phascolarctobacterium sp.]MDO5380210.1 hypothetical protein [Acidaminococcaceae bacterium]
MRIIDQDKWFAERRAMLVNLKPSLRPKKSERPIKSRSPEKSRALGLACKRAWERALETGKYVKTERGYRICETVIK